MRKYHTNEYGKTMKRVLLLLVAFVTVAANAEPVVLKASLITGGKKPIDQVSYSYARGTIRPEDWQNTLGNKKSFDQLQTVQFVTEEPLTSAARLFVADTSATNTCAEVMYKNKQAYMPLQNDSTDLGYDFLAKLGISSDAASQPKEIHLTVIPYTSTANSCDAPQNISGNQVFSIWIANSAETPATPKNAIVCQLQNPTDNKVSKLPYTDASNPLCVFDKPHWNLLQDPQSNLWVVQYTGTLHTLMKNARAAEAVKKVPVPIVINIPLHQDVRIPLTTEYVQYPISQSIDTSADGDCAKQIAAYNSDPAKEPLPFACFVNAPIDPSDVNYQRSYTYSEPFDAPIYVEGFGRIDGRTVIGDYTGQADGAPDGRACKGGSANLGSIKPCMLPTQEKDNPGQEFMRYARWRIYTSLLGLSSSYKPTAHTKSLGDTPGYQGSDPALSVTGITVSNTPKRNRSVIQLNVAQFGVKGGIKGDPAANDRDANNQPVVMNDVKQVGVWQDASDGPDVGSDGSVMKNMYFQINDDSVKIEAQNQYYHNVTLLQGGVGGVMLGMYGVTRDGVDNSVVDGVYVPRIIEKPAGTSWNDYGSTHGLISTRTCPRYFQNNDGMAGGTLPSLRNATIRNVRVFALAKPGSDPTQEPNSLDALVSIGVAADSKSYYCGTNFDTGVQAPSFAFGPIHLNNIVGDLAMYNMSSYTPAQNPFVLYSIAANTKVTWAGIDFGQVSATSNTADGYFSAYQASPTPATTYLYACGSPKSGYCMKMTGPAGTTSSVKPSVPNINVPADAPMPAALEDIVSYPTATTEN